MLIYVHIRGEWPGVGQCRLPGSLMTGWLCKWGRCLFLFPILQVRQLRAQEESMNHSWSQSREIRLEPKATNASSNYCSIFHSLVQTVRWTAHEEDPSIPGQIPCFSYHEGRHYSVLDLFILHGIWQALIGLSCYNHIGNYIATCLSGTNLSAMP